MNASISSTCEWPRYRAGKGGPWVACGQSVRYDGPDGTVHLVMWDSHRARYVGPCCWHRAGGVLEEQAIAMYGKDWAKTYTLHVDNPVEEKREALLRQRFRWTLTPTMPQRQGGLVRQDGSDNMSVGMPYIPTPVVRKA